MTTKPSVKGEIWDEARPFKHKETWTCPSCGYTTEDFSDFDVVLYEGGSAGKRVLECPECGQYLK